MIQVLIVDDSPSVRLRIMLVLESDPELKVIGEARNGEESVVLCQTLRPDIVTMDIMMLGMGQGRSPVVKGYVSGGRLYNHPR